MTSNTVLRLCVFVLLLQICCSKEHPLARRLTLINFSGCPLNLYYINKTKNDERVLKEEGLVDGSTTTSTVYTGHEFEIAQVPTNDDNACDARNATFQINEKYHYGQIVAVEEGLELYDPGPLKLNRDFSLYEEINALESLEDLMRRPNTRIRWQRRLFRKGPIFAVMENKLLSHSLLTSMGIPKPQVYYGAFATKAMGEWPKYNREEFIKALKRTPQVTEDHLFVIKPATFENAQGTIVMNHEKWVREGWTIERLADEVEEFMNIDFSEWGQQYEHVGVVVQQSVLAQGANVVKDEGSFDAQTSAVEMKPHVVFGKLCDASINMVPENPKGHMRASFCLGEPNMWSISKNNGATVEFWEELRPTIQTERLAEIAEQIANVFGADWFRLDVFVDTKGMLLVNEVTYPSGEHPGDCTFPRLYNTYKKGAFELLDPRSVLESLLERINISYDVFIETSDYPKLRSWTEEQYDSVDFWNYHRNHGDDNDDKQDNDKDVEEVDGVSDLHQQRNQDEEELDEDEHDDSDGAFYPHPIWQILMFVVACCSYLYVYWPSRQSGLKKDKRQ